MSAANCRVGASYPVAPSSRPEIVRPGNHGVSISRSGAGDAGSMSNWYPRPVGWQQEGRERELIALRSQDLHGSNPHAASLIDSIAINSVGSGLIPQSMPNWKRLGITEEAARDIADKMEWEFKLWSREACAESNSSDINTSIDFGFRTLQNITQMLIKGEFVNLPLMIDDPNRRYSLALQSVDPLRMRTPLNLKNSKDVRDGIRVGKYGQPISHFIADPQDGRITTSLNLRSYKELPAMIGHRPGVIHRFIPKHGAEQQRGVGTLGPSLKGFKDIHDYLDFELMAAIVAANFPVWIEKTTGQDMGMNADDIKRMQSGNDIFYRNLVGGGIHYGNAGEKPHIMESKRQPTAFEAFVQTIIRSIGASSGMPYEVVAKDFSKTNYSSARAALEEAYRVFTLYQDWLIRGFLDVVYRMVMEEAVLRGYIELPGGIDSFYENVAEWTNVSWTRPKRGSIDPVKDALAFEKLRKIPGASTLADFHGAQGADWEEKANQGARENQHLDDVGLLVTPDGDIQVVPVPGKEGAAQPSAAVDHESLRKDADTYGIAVRSGRITAQTKDEEEFRVRAGLQPMSTETVAAWESDGGTRRPVTLKSGDAFEAEQDKLAGEGGAGGDGSGGDSEITDDVPEEETA